MQNQSLRVMIGGVPFGRNNIGDEAILEGVVTILRHINATIDILVSTDDQLDTAAKLNVRTCPLFGFSHVKYDELQVRAVLKTQDLYIWCGATGLSDYPEDALGILDICHELNVPSVIFGTGMNSELNPLKYTLQPGRKKQILGIIKYLSCGFVDAVKIYEKHLQKSTCQHMNETLKYPELLVLRDHDTAHRVNYVCPEKELSVGADPAIIIPEDKNFINSTDQHTQELLKSKSKKIGICISAQREVQQFDDLVKAIDSWIEKYDVKIFFIPMNPITDRDLMASIQSKLQRPESTTMVTNCLEPGEIVAISAKMNLIISSRLHLLILSSINNIPLIGISRGSKVDTFLRYYGLKAAGSVENLDLFHLNFQVKHFIEEDCSYFLARGKVVRNQMMERLNQGVSKLAGVIEDLSNGRQQYA